jgi:hypothetical protein
MSWIKSFQMVLFALLIVAERCTNACAQGKLPELIREPIKNDDQPLLEQRMITFLDMLNRFPKAQIKDRHFFVDQRLFCGMFCLLGTIDASAVREMNL